MRRLTERDGLGYRLDMPRDGITLRVDYLRESSGELHGELIVERAPEGHLVRGRFNLTSPTTRATMAKDLAARSKDAKLDWRELLERFCMEVLDLHREGEPWLKVGRMPARERPPYLMYPFVYEHKPTILFGAGGLGKSTAIAATIAVAVASGTLPSTFPGWYVARRGPVLILDWEADPEDWNDSIAGVCKGLGMDEPVELDYRQMRLPLDAQVNVVADMVQRTHAVLVIVDSAEAAMRSPREGGDDPVKRFYDALRMIPCASLVIDHVTKWAVEHGGPGSPIGSVAKTNRARATWELRSAGPDSDDGTRHLSLVNRKNNMDRPHEPIGAAVLRADGAIRLWHEVLTQATPEAKEKALWERIRDLLALGTPMTVPEIVGALALRGKDPVRLAENAMGRHMEVFAHTTGNRYERRWYVQVGLLPDDQPVAGQVIAFPRSMLPEHAPDARETGLIEAPLHNGAPIEARSMLPEHASMLAARERGDHIGGGELHSGASSSSLEREEDAPDQDSRGGSGRGNGMSGSVGDRMAALIRPDDPFGDLDDVFGPVH